MSKEIKIYVANLSSYNSGNIIGNWFTLPTAFSTISKALKLGQAGFGEEWIILDSEAPLRINEYESIDRLNHIAESLDLLPDFVIDNLDEILGYEDLESLLENEGEKFRIYNDANNEEDLGYAVVDEMYGDIGELPVEVLQRYFDYTSYGREIEIGSDGFYGTGGYIEYIG